MKRKRNVLLLILLFVCCVFGSLFAQEEKISITTYYPSPYGSYHELRADRMAIGDNYAKPDYCWPPETCTNAIGANADLIVEGRVGIGLRNPHSALHVDQSYVLLSDIDGNTGVNDDIGHPSLYLATYNLNSPNTSSKNGPAVKHAIFGPYNATNGTLGALYIGVGRKENFPGISGEANGERNSIVLYNRSCTPNEGEGNSLTNLNCNARNIILYSDRTEISNINVAGSNNPKPASPALHVKNTLQLEPTNETAVNNQFTVNRINTVPKGTMIFDGTGGINAPKYFDGNNWKLFGGSLEKVVVDGPATCRTCAGGPFSEATCPTGTILIGGGHIYNTQYMGSHCDTYRFVLDSYPEGNTWRVRTECFRASARAICLKQ